ncbi:hypothetical protein [Parvularcula marina]|uniref:hypothetical protein n=1 Tax=Parvularcula marina TaxID=2292771 RepID=UPI0035126109
MSNYSQGGDQQAIARIIKDHYGDYPALFEFHDWLWSGSKAMNQAAVLIKGEYGSIKAFELAHDLMSPVEAIKSDPPNVWLSSQNGFDPHLWGFIGFSPSKAYQRETFLNNSKPGVLWVCYGAKTHQTPIEMRGRVLGIFQLSHVTGSARDFMHPVEYRRKELDPEQQGKWTSGIKAVQAWEIPEGQRPTIEEFAPDTYGSNSARHIGSQGVVMLPNEAQNILSLTLRPVDVYGQPPLMGAVAASGRQVLKPSRQGPVSQSPYHVREAEGPKHLYIFKLTGDASLFSGREAGSKLIIKAGFSGNPSTRCNDLNNSLPQGAYRWEILHSGPVDGIDPYPSSQHVLAGERRMQELLFDPPNGISLGGEFFLAEPDLIEAAWGAGNETARGVQE